MASSISPAVSHLSTFRGPSLVWVPADQTSHQWDPVLLVQSNVWTRLSSEPAPTSATHWGGNQLMGTLVWLVWWSSCWNKTGLLVKLQVEREEEETRRWNASKGKRENWYLVFDSDTWSISFFHTNMIKFQDKESWEQSVKWPLFTKVIKYNITELQ